MLFGITGGLRIFVQRVSYSSTMTVVIIVRIFKLENDFDCIPSVSLSRNA